VKYTKEYSVAVVGATGNTGMKTMEILAERDFPIANIIPIASERSVGKDISFRNGTLKVQGFSEVDFSKVDIAFFCAGGAFSKKYADFVADQGCVVIDKSSHFRLNPRVPLIIPEVNARGLSKYAALGIISTPNCVVIPLAITLKALSDISPIKRVVVSTYQSVSGAGRRGTNELFDQTKNITSLNNQRYDVFQKQIAFNVIPAIGNILQSGASDEEEKISSEICKVLKSDAKIAVTCVRVPVFIGHCMSVACEFSRPVLEENVYDAFENFDGITVIDRRNEQGAFASPIDVQGEDAVYVSRVRRDVSIKNGVLYWIASDNLRKGAALNSVQIAEELIGEDPQLTLFRRRSDNKK
jgi:aspartate-semialdehyde dehydrogenase